MNDNYITYCDRFGAKHFLKEIKTLTENKSIITNIYRTQAYDSTMCGYFGIGFIDFMCKGKSLTDFTNLFLPKNLKDNGKVMLNYFLNWN